MKGRWATYSGEAKRAHREAQAEWLLVLELAVMGVGLEELTSGPKGMATKQVLAWWLCQRTTVARRWVSERLRIGDESRVTQAIRRIKAGGDPEWRALRQRLERAGENQD